ncbi:MAG TPA: WD40 repeat domain-containing protein, partial [Phycisphaerae bacterium]|nr:WD40 repeat domain-containing protein [Phycisphaerae bacterium]
AGGFDGGIPGLAFSPDGLTLAASSWDGALRVWDLAGKKQVAEIARPHSPFYRLAFTRDGGTLLAGGADGIVCRMDPKGPGPSPPAGAYEGPIHAAAFCPDGGTLATAGRDNTVRLWEAASGRELRKLASAAAVHRIAFSPNGDQLACAAVDGAVRLYAVASGKPGGNYETGTGGFHALAFDPEGKVLLVVGSNGQVGSIALHHGGKPEFRKLDGQCPSLIAASFSPDGEYVVTVERTTPPGKLRISSTLDIGEGLAIRLYRLDTGQCVFSVPERLVEGVSIAPMLDLLPYHGFGRYRVVELCSGGEVIRSGEAGARPNSLRSRITVTPVFSPDGRVFAVGDVNGTVSVCDAATGEGLARLTGHHGPIQSIAFSADGNRLATASADTTALVWDLRKLLPPAKTVELNEKELQQLWDDLASRSAADAWRAAGRLIAAGDRAADFLKGRLKPAQPIDPVRLGRLLAELDDTQYATREKAQKELRTIGRDALPAMREALRKTQSLEVRSRLRMLVDELDTFTNNTPEEMRRIRALSVLERIGSRRAAAVLERLSEGAPGADLTRRAAAALRRVAARGKKDATWQNDRPE